MLSQSNPNINTAMTGLTGTLTAPSSPTSAASPRGFPQKNHHTHHPQRNSNGKKKLAPLEGNPALVFKQPP